MPLIYITAHRNTNPMEQAAHQNLVLEIDQIDLPYTRSTLLSSKLDHSIELQLFLL